jgi:HAD superfamily hydrolase (TIGR01509 family)
MVENGKPNPEIYNKALDLLQVEAKEALCFEDTEIGIEAAVAAGIPVMKIDKSFYED